MKAGHVLRVVVVCALLVIGTSCRKQSGSSADPTEISKEQLKEWMDHEADVCILDVRSKEEFDSGHIPKAMNINYTEISSRLDELNPYRNHKIVLYCRTGRRARIAEKTLKDAGFSDIYHLAGNMPGWREAGLPIESGRD